MENRVFYRGRNEAHPCTIFVELTEKELLHRQKIFCLALCWNLRSVLAGCQMDIDCH